MVIQKITSASFFAGIGGFDLGFEKVGIETTFQCEIDDFCTRVLELHWPNTNRHRDICNLDASLIPDSQIWCGGFPCQDVSLARGWRGRDGLKGSNSGLFYKFAELIESRLPQVVIMENVTGLLNSHNGKDFAIILSTLGRLGYGVAWRTLNTRYFGAPQSRPRIFICAWANSTSSAYHVLFEGGRCSLPEKPRLGFLREFQCQTTGMKVPEVAFCLAATSGRHTGTDWSRSYVAYESEVRRLTPTEYERIQGFPTNWTLAVNNSSVGSVDIDSSRYQAIGNAVSVPVSQWIGKRILQEIYQPNMGVADNNLQPKISRFGNHTPALSDKGSCMIDLADFLDCNNAPRVKWGSGGIMEGGVCLMGSISQCPREPINSRLIDFLDRDRPDEKYFLTPNAAKGILRRVYSQGRRLFDPLSVALKRLQNSA